jgi:hypothetical protein
MKNTKYSPAKIRSASFNEQDNTVEVCWSMRADVVRCDDFGNEFVERLLMGDGNVRLGCFEQRRAST